MWCFEVLFDAGNVVTFLNEKKLKPFDVTIVYDSCGSYVIFYFEKEKL